MIGPEELVYLVFVCQGSLASARPRRDQLPSVIAVLVVTPADLVTVADIDRPLLLFLEVDHRSHVTRWFWALSIAVTPALPFMSIAAWGLCRRARGLAAGPGGPGSQPRTPGGWDLRGQAAGAGRESPHT